MKKIIIVAFLLIVALNSFSQSLITIPKKQINLTYQKAGTHQKSESYSLNKGVETTLNETFENTFFPPMSWSVDGSEWYHSTQTANGIDLNLVEDSAIGHTGHFAVFDAFNGALGLVGSLVTPILHPTAGNNTLSFFVNLIKISSNPGYAGTGAELYIEFSTNGGTTWTTSTTNVLAALPNFNIATTGWHNLVVSLAAYNGQSVTVRFRAVSDYGWCMTSIDNVTGPDADVITIANDLAINKIYADFSGMSFYSVTPLSQLGPVNFGAAIINNGLNIQSNITLTADINNGAYISSIGTNNPIAFLAPCSKDTLWADIALADTGFTEFATKISVNGNQTDENPGDNFDSIYFYADPTSYMRGGNMTSLLSPYSFGTGAPAATGMEYGANYHFINNDRIDSINVYIYNSTGTGTIVGKLYEVSNIDGSRILVAQTAPYTPSNSIELKSLALQTPVIVSFPAIYTATVQLNCNISAHDTINIIGDGTFLGDAAQGAAYLNISGTWGWYYITNTMPLVGLTVQGTPGTPPQITNQPLSQIICEGSSVTFHITATGAMHYQWKKNNINIPGATSNTLIINNVTNADSGEYSCSVSNTHGTTISNTAILTVSHLNFTISGIDSVCNNSGNIIATVINGTTPFLYSWSTGDTNDTITISNGGNYCVTVTDSLGCHATVCHTVSTSFSVSPDISNALCSGQCNGSIALTLNGGMQPFQYAWSNSETVSTIQNLCPGLYSVTITDANLCSYAGNYTITGLSNLVTNINSNNEFCGLHNGSATVLPDSGVAPYFYTWSDGTHNSAITGLNEGTYYVTVTDSLNCSVFDTIVIQDTLIPVQLYTTENTTLCDEGSVMLYAIPGNSLPETSYLWSTGQTTNTIIVYPYTTDTYYVTVSSGNCIVIDSVTVTVLPCHNIITGLVFSDINQNGIMDNGETPLPDIIVSDSQFYYYCSTDPSGIFRLYVDTGYYEISAYLQPHYAAIPQTQNAYFATYGQIDTANNFGIHHDLVQDVSVNVYDGPARPGFSVDYYIYFENTGAFTTSGSVKFVKDNLLNYTNSYPSPDNISLDTLEWNYINLLPGEYRYIYAGMYLPPGVPLETALNSYAVIYPVVGDTAPENNYYPVQQIVTGSWDPNDKTLNPAVLTPDYIQQMKPLTYTIRFQNTGTDTAFNIKILDTLCSNVNPATFHLIASSHPCAFHMYGHGIVEFTFANILLPDSNTNEPLSNGFVMYSVLPKDSLDIGDTITNFADIFFDYNQPVRTNTVISPIVDTTTFIGKIYYNNDNSLFVYPNPFTLQTNVQYEISQPTEVSIDVFNVIGEKVTTLFHGLRKEGIYRVAMNVNANGIYFIKYTTNRKSMYVKVIKTE
ncbi:MAG: immunoglobulin domain-containing protein [Bacteroidia bacterium]|nr:immunoglobulin domain-containing protein [Bacteroidia bacterium]